MRCDTDKKVIQKAIAISIHAPRVRCDHIMLNSVITPIDFNPRTSCEVRHFLPIFTTILFVFQSTHLVWGATSREENDKKRRRNFNPRTSCEVRLFDKFRLTFGVEFQSTHLVWGATRSWWHGTRHYTISIHAPRVRCDVPVIFFRIFLVNFNPRTSCEVRLSNYGYSAKGSHFNPRTSCEVRLSNYGYSAKGSHFNPRTSCEVRQN